MHFTARLNGWMAQSLNLLGGLDKGWSQWQPEVSSFSEPSSDVPSESLQVSSGLWACFLRVSNHLSLSLSLVKTSQEIQGLSHSSIWPGNEVHRGSNPCTDAHTPIPLLIKNWYGREDGTVYGGLYRTDDHFDLSTAVPVTMGSFWRGLACNLDVVIHWHKTNIKLIVAIIACQTHQKGSPSCMKYPLYAHGKPRYCSDANLYDVNDFLHLLETFKLVL